jgi:hypothetical protein
MTPDSEAAWAKLESRAQRLLEHAREVEPREPVRRHGSILRLWHYPAYGPQKSWTLLRSGRKTTEPRGARVREVTWDRGCDERRLFPSDVSRAGGAGSEPTILLREADLEEAEVEALLSAAGNLAVPVVLFAHTVGLDGEFWGLETYEVSPSVRLQWWGRGPVAWRHFTDWFDQLRTLLLKRLEQTG